MGKDEEGRVNGKILLICAKVGIEDWMKFLGCRYGGDKIWRNFDYENKSSSVYR